MESSRVRFLKALAGEKPDRVPLSYVTAFTNLELQQLTGCFMPDVHLDGEKLFRLCAAVHEVLGFDAVTFIINAFNEPAALGCKMDWGNSQRYPMCVSNPWTDVDDIMVPNDFCTGNR